MPPRILVVGGGYVGLYVAMNLQKRLKPGEAKITVVDPKSYMTYQPFLPEAGSGNLEPRHVIAPLRRVLNKCEIINGRIVKIDHASRIAVLDPLEGPTRELAYDTIVVCPGSIARTLPIPGLHEQGIGFKSVAEAIYLRNHVLERMDAASSSTDPVLRRRALTFVFVGGGYAGIEALAELEDMARDACKYYPNLGHDEMRWVLVEASGRILPEVSPAMGEYTAMQLTQRGIEVRRNTRLTSVVGGHVMLDDGDEFDCETLVWTAGVRANPMLESTDLPLDDRKRVVCTPFLQVKGTPGAWASGDSAAVPDLSVGGDATTGPSAQHAVRQAKRLAQNILAEMRGQPLVAYEHAYAGSVASLGLYKGVAEIYGIKLRGFPAWFAHRTYHVSRVPTLNRKVRVLTDWTIALLFRREIVSLGAFQDPQADFRAAAAPTEKAS
ncbi:MAG TPA: NAD(P)/FAD-dependent oxidoreductase [Frankiaceae bacterium]|nr:NAD(P)/FAD-dependent oxidoreductase [Frankiaceae bacterium]